MARPSPQSFEKRQREIRKRRKREEKLERRLWRNEEKRIAKEGGDEYYASSEYGPRPEGAQDEGESRQGPDGAPAQEDVPRRDDDAPGSAGDRAPE